MTKDKDVAKTFKKYSWDHDALATDVTESSQGVDNRPGLPVPDAETEARATALIKKAVDSGLIIMKLPK